MGKPEQIGRVVSRVLKRSGTEKGVKQKQAVLIWDKVVGERVAAHSKAIKVENRKIFIRVKSPTWRTELLLMKGKILEELNRSLGKKVIQDIILIGK